MMWMKLPKKSLYFFGPVTVTSHKKNTKKNTNVFENDVSSGNKKCGYLFIDSCTSWVVFIVLDTKLEASPTSGVQTYQFLPPWRPPGAELSNQRNDPTLPKSLCHGPSKLDDFSGWKMSTSTRNKTKKKTLVQTISGPISSGKRDRFTVKRVKEVDGFHLPGLLVFEHFMWNCKRNQIRHST